MVTPTPNFDYFRDTLYPSLEYEQNTPDRSVMKRHFAAAETSAPPLHLQHSAFDLTSHLTSLASTAEHEQQLHLLHKTGTGAIPGSVMPGTDHLGQLLPGTHHAHSHPHPLLGDVGLMHPQHHQQQQPPPAPVRATNR